MDTTQIEGMLKRIEKKIDSLHAKLDAQEIGAPAIKQPKPRVKNSPGYVKDLIYAVLVDGVPRHVSEIARLVNDRLEIKTTESNISSHLWYMEKDGQATRIKKGIYSSRKTSEPI